VRPSAPSSDTDVEAAIGDLVRQRPIIGTRPRPLFEKAGALAGSNPFTAIEETNRELAEVHERLRSLVTRLAGELPEFEHKIAPAAGGLLGLTTSAAHSMTARARDIGQLCQRLEEFMA
jgi:hypothetical protein